MDLTSLYYIHKVSAGMNKELKRLVFTEFEIEKGSPITATVMAARAAIDLRDDVRLLVVHGMGDESTFTVQHALDKYEEHSVHNRIRELNTRLIELDGERRSTLKEIEAEREYLSKAQKLAAPNQ